jgi:hypothetical protein
MGGMRRMMGQRPPADDTMATSIGPPGGSAAFDNNCLLAPFFGIVAAQRNDGKQI